MNDDKPTAPPAGEVNSFVMVRRLLGEHGRQHGVAYGVALALMALSAGATVLSVSLLQPIINGMTGFHIAEGNAFKELRFLAFSVAGLYILRGIATFGQLTIMSRTGNRIVATIQARVYDHILRQPVSFFQQRHSSDLMARLALAANSVREVVQLLVTTAGRDALTLVGLVCVMVFRDPTLALLLLILMPLGAVLLGRLMRRVRFHARRQFDGSTRIMGTIQETVQGIRIVKSFNLEEVMRGRMAASIRDVEKAANRVARGVAMSSPVSETLGGVAVALLILYGGWRVAVAHADPGSFVAFIVAMLMAYEPAKRLGRMNLDLQNGLVNARMIYELLDEPTPDADDGLKPPLAVTAGRIAFHGVGFRYRPNEMVLDGMTFVAEPDRTTALVGPSGGGKSTIIGLIQRFYAPQAGMISIDGVDIASVEMGSLRDKIAFVSQDVFLFQGTIADNIGLGRLGASPSEIVAAARKAHAHDFITALSDGYGTLVGEQGGNLSGGQRQRIAIARAFLKQAPILLLDEPTAALDSESEREIQKALDDLRAGRTTIVVAHRLQTIVDADRICVVEAGRAVEVGTHAELIQLKGAYHTFFATQFGDRARRIA
jgi:ATP-binding cassette subfamily B protein